MGNILTWERAMDQVLTAYGQLLDAARVLEGATGNGGPHVTVLRRQVAAAREKFLAQLAPLRQALGEVRRELARLQANQERLHSARTRMRTDYGQRALEGHLYSNEGEIKKIRELHDRMTALIEDVHPMLERAKPGAFAHAPERSH